ncbi:MULTISPECIES: HNH endonuclease [Variovorax]|uniref:HNH endonuclease n=1 Tax=Variovorax TaxID=34072 RepID=UPI0028638EE4|nr:HNH endonuclease [Variovorax sp. 3319]MDR6887827.1 hypothetical protein [Variovorax sp. 3319]
MTPHTVESIMAGAAESPFWSQVDMSGGPEACWPWKGPVDSDGYGYEGRERVHRTAWERFNRESLKPGEVVMHSCDNPPCCHPDHVIAARQRDNNADRAAKDRGAKGEENGRAVLTEAEVLEIFNSIGSYAAIGKRFNVSKWSVRDIKTGRNWAWLTAANSHGGNKEPGR